MSGTPGPNVTTADPVALAANALGRDRGAPSARIIDEVPMPPTGKITETELRDSPF